MKKFLFLLLTFVSMNVMAQDSLRVYCELVGTGKLFSSKVNVEVDFGQETNFWNQSTEHFLIDENGDKIKFNSMVDAMNYMGRFGWEFEQAYVVTTNQQNVYHWLLSKVITASEDINDGITTHKQFIESKKDKKKQEFVDDTY